MHFIVMLCRTYIPAQCVHRTQVQKHFENEIELLFNRRYRLRMEMLGKTFPILRFFYYFRSDMTSMIELCSSEIECERRQCASK